jgi:CBS domain containing-hemolysin-like protein
VLEAMVSSQHSRLPVWEEAPEHMVGVVFFKDLLRIWHERRAQLRTGRSGPEFQVRRIMRKPLIVPETKALLQMLEEFQASNTHMALIVDEFGTVTGLLTAEDVLERIVGEIEDEFDDALDVPQTEDREFDIDGATTILDLESLHGIELPVNAGFETVAGYMLYRLGHIPQPGESVEFEDRRLTVSLMERNRIARVKVEKIGPGTTEEATVAGN